MLVVHAVARDERHPPPADLPDGDGSRRRTVRRVDLELSDLVEEPVEPRPPDDADRGTVVVEVGAQADFSFAPSDEVDPDFDALASPDGFASPEGFTSPDGFASPDDEVPPEPPEAAASSADFDPAPDFDLDRESVA